MNIDTLLEAAMYVESGGVVAERSFTRGKDEIDSKIQKPVSPAYPSILEKQLTGPPPSQPPSSASPQPRYIQQAHIAPPPLPSATQPAASLPPGVVTSPANTPPNSSSIIQHASRFSIGSHPVPLSYHLYPHAHPQQLHQPYLPQHHPPPAAPSSHHPSQQPPAPPHHHALPLHRPQLQERTEQQHPPSTTTTTTTSAPSPSPSPSGAPPSHPVPHPLHQLPSHHAPPHHVVPISSSSSSSHLVTPKQAMDLLHLHVAEAQGRTKQQQQQATLSPVPTSRGAIPHPAPHPSNMSPRLVHQIVSHDQWVAGERASSPKQSPSLSKPSAESDSNDSAYDGSGKDKRAGIREVHNKLEKNRRAHLKECFDNLRLGIPNMEDKKSKTSNLSILRGALRYIQVLNRKERELEHELDRLVRQKIENQQRLHLLKIKNGMSTSETVKLPSERDEEEEEEDDAHDRLVVVEKMDIDVEAHDDDKKSYDEDDQASTSTASEAEEEERKSLVHSRSQSPLHHPVTSHLIHATYPLPGVSTSYQQSLAGFHAVSHAASSKPTSVPYTNAPPHHVIGLSRSSSEAMLQYQVARDSQPPPGLEHGRVSHRLDVEGLRVRHDSAPTGPSQGVNPRTTCLQMTQDNVSTVLQSVASQISPTRLEPPPAVVTQPSNATAGSLTRQTVSQLLGKQPMARQPVRRQVSLSQQPVIHSAHQASRQLLPRIMNTSPPVRLGFSPTTQPSLTAPPKPVITVGINSLLAQPSVIQTASTHKTVISNGLVPTSVAELSTVAQSGAGAGPRPPPPALTASSPLTAPIASPLAAPYSTPLTAPLTSPLTAPVLTNPLSTTVLGTTEAAAAAVSKSLMTASVITQTLPVMSHSPFISPIALQSPATAGASLLFTHPASSYIGLRPSMITQPFIGSFAATRPSQIQVASSAQVTPSSAITQPLVHPSVQPIEALNNSAISLALAQAALPKHLPQLPAAGFPGAVNISGLPASALMPSTLPGARPPFTPSIPSTLPPPTPISTPAPAQVKPKTSSSPVSSKGKGSRTKHSKSLNGKTEIQITTSKIAETMANLVNSQVMAKNGHPTNTVNTRTSQQSVVVKLKHV